MHHMIPQKTSSRFFILSTVFFILISVIIVFLVNTQMRKHALFEAESKASILLDRSLAIHTFFSHQLKPALFKITDEIKPKSYFDPVWMSSTYAIREIQKYFKSISGGEFYYKECAINARSPENEADAFEKSFIQELNHNKDLNVKAIERSVEGQPYFQILRRGEVMEESCLRCHSTPSNAPEDLTRQYGPERSFDRSIGEVVSAISIRIPLAAAYVNANRFSVTLSLSLLSLLFIFYLVTWLTARYMIFRPLDLIQQKTNEIIANPNMLGNQIRLPHGKELKDLTLTFNQLSFELRKQRDGLETKVKEKTAHLKKEIDERVRSENEVRKSETKYRQLFENMMNGFALHEIICDEKGHPVDYRFLSVNPAFERLTGLKSEALMGKTVREVMPKIETHWIEKYGQVAATGKPIEFENYSQELGRYFHVMSFRPAPKQFACIFQDITERKQSENTLRKSEKKFRSMMDSFTDPLYICSSEFKIEYMNPAMTRRIGRNATGEPCYGALHGLDRKCDWCVFDKVGSGEIIEGDIKSPLDDRNYHVTNMPIDNPDGAIAKMSIFRDTTDYLKALSEKEQAQEHLRQAHKMKAIGTLTGGIAHEFNNMLGIIIGNVELAADDIAEDNPAADYIEEIRIASLRARDVVQKLMIAAQKNPTQRKPIQISAVVKDSLDLLRKTIPADIDIRPKIACTSERILADQSEIHQVMINLCTNSAHAVKNESGVLEVLLETVTLDERFAARFKDLLPGDYVRLTVRDNGEGIAPGDMDRIFDPYFTTKDVDEGLGMGLAVVHGIVKKNNGAIHIESNVGKGTTVEVLFPLLETLSKEKVEQSETLPTGTERILFVDDEASLVKMVKQMLERSGYEVVGKTSSTDAVKVFTENPGRFDLVISDISMPDMPGDRLAQKMIQIRPDIPIIVCTGHSDRIDEKKAQDMGIQAFIMKPLTKADLTKTVRKVLDGKN